MTTAAPTAQIRYDDLYQRWEAGNWSASAIDLTQDRADWERMTPQQRDCTLWFATLFLHGEESVANHLGPYLDAAPLPEQKYFLATQQVDEARHAVFFERFLHEVAGHGDGTPAGILGATDSGLTWGHREVFGRLETTAAELRDDPSPARLAAAVTLYHLMIEGAMAQPAQHLLETAVARLGILPGFLEGMRRVAADEQRHIGFGVKLLADLYAADPEPIEAAIVATVRELLPRISASAQPPTWDESFIGSMGFALVDLFEESSRSLELKVRAVGLPLDERPRFPLPIDRTPRERAEEGIALLRAGLIGGPDVPVRNDPEALAVLFDVMRRQADPTQVRRRTVVEWDFLDADPWHVVIEEPAASAHAGHAPHADLRLRMALKDFVDLLAERADPVRLLMRRRLRVRGKPWVMAQLGKVFA